MRGMFGPLELLEQPRLRQEQRITPVLLFALFGTTRSVLITKIAQFGVFDLVRD